MMTGKNDKQVSIQASLISWLVKLKCIVAYARYIFIYIDQWQFVADHIPCVIICVPALT